MAVTVLIPTYYGNALALNCINSLMIQCPEVPIMVYKNSDGWLQAANKMMQSVKTDVLLMNDDTVALTNLAQEMSSLAYSNPKIGIIGGKSFAPDQETVINYGIYIAPDGNTAHKHFGENKRDITSPEKQKAVEGSCLYIKREVLEKVGYF